MKGQLLGPWAEFVNDVIEKGGPARVRNALREMPALFRDQNLRNLQALESKSFSAIAKAAFSGRIAC